ncbi:hypothetical protein [Sutcliffiella horikoshii]|uniref:hypothetical protein n=1 Tax=Sutcliffiella horikoshii TaxID=79883 RepID=UPI001CFDC341|nr:hypothetical protein [Sutcliffiella horikoshii]
MVTIDKEVLKVKLEPKSLKKDIVWQVNQENYIIHNVPYTLNNSKTEEYLDINVTITVTALRDLMVSEQLPSEINFDDFSDVKFQ